MSNPNNPASQTRAVIHRIFSTERSLNLSEDALRWIEEILSYYVVPPEELEHKLAPFAIECELEAIFRGLD